tara:strand:- start:3553 stop:4536 length:984 start_codon:yes stop_codon:yes gene_type:complete
MQNKIDLDNQSFFGKGVEFWLGMIVSFDKQRSQVSGEKGWGWRYKVRIIGDYSDHDSVEDKDVHTAVALIPTTGGTGGAGKSATVKLTQGDVVFGVFLSPNNGFPVILGALGRTPDSAKEADKNGDSKLAPKPGFTSQQKPGLTETQEFTGQATVETPKLKAGGEKGGGKTKSTPTGDGGESENKGLEKIEGGLDKENSVDALPDPSRIKKVDQPVGFTDKATEDLGVGETNREVLQGIENERALLDGQEPRKIEVSKTKKELVLRPTDTGNDRINNRNKRINALLLKDRYGGTGYPITIGDKTYQPQDPGYLDAYNTAAVIPSANN